MEAKTLPPWNSITKDRATTHTTTDKTRRGFRLRTFNNNEQSEGGKNRRRSSQSICCAETMNCSGAELPAEGATKTEYGTAVSPQNSYIQEETQGSDKTQNRSLLLASTTLSLGSSLAVCSRYGGNPAFWLRRKPPGPPRKNIHCAVSTIRCYALIAW